MFLPILFVHRYQRVSPDYLPLANTKKPYLRPSPSRSNDNGRTIATANATAAAGGGRFNGTSTIISNSNLDGVPKGFRFRSTPITTTTPQQQQQQDLPHDSATNLTGAGGDGLLQWGQRKRSRASRAEIRSVSVAADDSSSSSGQSLIPSSKLQRRSTNPSMPPPSPSRTTNPRNGIVIGKESSRFVPTRFLANFFFFSNRFGFKFPFLQSLKMFLIPFSNCEFQNLMYFTLILSKLFTLCYLDYLCNFFLLLFFFVCY